MKTVGQTIIKADGFYTIAAKNGNVIQAVEGAKDGSDIRLGKYERKPEQEWSFVREGDGVYRIKNRANGKLIDLMYAGTANGTWLHLWEDVNGTSQMWTLRPTPEGTMKLISSWAGGKCVDTVGYGAEINAILQIWQESGAEEQLWVISEAKAKRAAKSSKKAEPKAEPVPETEPASVEIAAPASAPIEAVAEAPAQPEKPKRKCARRKKAE